MESVLAVFSWWSHEFIKLLSDFDQEVEFSGTIYLHDLIRSDEDVCGIVKDRGYAVFSKSTSPKDLTG